jgi:hypothetical protein
MSITNIDLSSEPGSRSASIDSKKVTSYRYVFTVISDNKNDDGSYIRNNLSFPYPSTPLQIGTVHPVDANAYCTAIEASFASIVEGTGAMWNATVTYGEWNPFTMVENPLDAPVLPVIEGQVFEYVADKDKDGNPIVNKASDPFDPPVVTEKTHLFFRFSKNYATLPAVFHYSNYINSDTWQNFGPYYIKFNLPRAQELPSQYLGSTYWKVDFEFEYNPDTWLTKLENKGYRQYVGGVQKQILVDGQPTTVPIYLDSSGVALTYPVTSANIVELTFHGRFETAFNSLFSDFPTDLFATYVIP